MHLIKFFFVVSTIVVTGVVSQSTFPMVSTAAGRTQPSFCIPCCVNSVPILSSLPSTSASAVRPACGGGGGGGGGVGCVAGALLSNNWAGYEVMANCAHTIVLTSVQASWPMPIGGEPWAGACIIRTCTLYTWVGLTSLAGGASGIVQAGTASYRTCGIVCNYDFKLWWEFFPGDIHFCDFGGRTPLAGDTIIVSIVNDVAVSPMAYNVNVADTTSTLACNRIDDTFAANGQADMGVPHFAQFIAEVPGCCTLPRFSAFSMNGAQIVAGGVAYGLGGLYGFALYNKYTMINNDIWGSHYNIDVGVPSGNNFVFTWLTSNGT